MNLRKIDDNSLKNLYWRLHKKRHVYWKNAPFWSSMRLSFMLSKIDAELLRRTKDWLMHTHPVMLGEKND